ncbi:methyl-accepting chemotaxis protein [Burkholderia pseudomallei]|uniref:methyl-accepting chemotaxis protein n=1 Tax=Burkholderia pseudomallei TaxID=28450 RepID=UPI001AAF7757|nr:methyl-accepting chemotaxis protein [Burkholderia pseudomallei]MBO3059288.1 Tar ligand binding domain-containing protein [Burkholderia pseudomallei]MBO7755149.1 Tar ligand binding domain-containing protein [Burkholderia pseudomallei]MBO7823532.1 Tar ligand binding domain-containing protein [Burkholderia pseudomallei]MBO7859612.1 Tar ligand binding domain-containing protein [Burkholderia pseudomallei]MBO7889479.1 Tar ligand binding domain-containing protein [Burkholderia pseudomallei]
MLLKNITIRARLAVTMALLSVLLCAVGALGLFGMSRANDANEQTSSNQLPSAIDVASAELFAARERLVLDRAALLAGTPDVAPTIERARQMRGVSDSWWKKYLDLPRDAQEDRLAQDLASKRQILQRELDAAAALINANDRDRILESAKRMQNVFNDFSLASEALRAFQLKQASVNFSDAQSVYAASRLASIAALALGLALSLYCFLSLRAAIARPLADALGHFDAIAAGELRRPIVVERRDEMGLLLEGLAKMQASLAGTVRAVRVGSESIATAARQIAAGNIDLSSRTEEQAAALEQTASSMEELTGTVRRNADNARQASALAASASEIANKGNAVVGQVVGTMGDINQSSAKIADIITIIEGIAFQTNILALNAAVEAARAGEEGRGFAVVAGEVRSLAQRSSTAAKEIKELIDTSVERVRTGSMLVDDAGRTMSEVIGAVRRVTDIMGEIAAASDEQSTGIDQVSRAVSQMDEVTQQNAALVEQAARLRATVSVFHVDDGDARDVASRPPARPGAGAVHRAAGAAAPAQAGASSGAHAAPAAHAARKPAPSAALAKAAPVASVASAASVTPAAPAPTLAAAAATPKPAPAAPRAGSVTAASAASDDDWETF